MKMLKNMIKKVSEEQEKDVTQTIDFDNASICSCSCYQLPCPEADLRQRYTVRNHNLAHSDIQSSTKSATVFVQQTSSDTSTANRPNHKTTTC
ncbi:hypothetical protein LOAG_15441 [Loa loa]|uniref:Uncharacterized protein n=1 Tax=Loa loa TaxID=7209 RepID=A0A1S0TFP3_LOALO|nr:hypothetical protein LOAG_15441 [Loa loa]EFO13089.2 hypothetical protein LOAG_15441 [Loa loa]